MDKKEEIAVFWFRRDLRIDDNHGFFKALNSGQKVLPIFVFDSNILSELPKNDARVEFIHKSLFEINDILKKDGSSIKIYHSNPVDAFKELVERYSISKVYTNKDYEPYAKIRDAEIEGLLLNNDTVFLKFKDQVIFEKDEIVKDDGNPYVVFTPFSKKWLAAFDKNKIENYESEKLLANLLEFKCDFPSLKDLGFEKSYIEFPSENVNESLLDHYQSTRNFPDKRTSRLGLHLRFGTISIRKLILKADDAKNPTYLKELIWREFFMQIIWHFPRTVIKSFRPKYDNIKWRNDRKEFKAWCDGRTGYPIVDAGMRELNTTGFMHNRVRMVVASFLCKHLLIDWRWGEAYFAEKLLDYEQSSNVGNWQWAAGSGVDAAPYFRIFNPYEQARKFDKFNKYISEYVPEFESENYPRPIIEHKEARLRALEVYKEAVK